MFMNFGSPLGNLKYILYIGNGFFFLNSIKKKSIFGNFKEITSLFPLLFSVIEKILLFETSN